MWSLNSPQCRSDLYKVSCKVHKRVTKEFYSWKKERWEVTESSVCGSKKLLYYPGFWVHRPLTHQFSPAALGNISKGSWGMEVCEECHKSFHAQNENSAKSPDQMSSMMVTRSRRGQCGKFPLAGGREEQWRRKPPWGSHFYGRDEARQECANAKTLTDKKDQEGAWCVRRREDLCSCSLPGDWSSAGSRTSKTMCLGGRGPRPVLLTISRVSRTRGNTQLFSKLKMFMLKMKLNSA